MAIEPIKGFYVHDEATDTDGVAKVSVEAVHEFVEDVDNSVRDYLGEHPEATTTVLPDSLTTDKYKDGSITSAKVDADFLEAIKNAYVTPEMYGAKGDGATDDTTAIQAAIDDNYGGTVYFSKKYLISSTIVTPSLDARKVALVFAPNASLIATSGTFYGNYMVYIGGKNDGVSNYPSSVNDCGLYGATLSCNSKCGGVYIRYVHMAKVINVTAHNVKGYGLLIQKSDNDSADAYIENFMSFGIDADDIDNIGVYINSSDNKIYHVRVSGCHTGFKIMGAGNYIEDAHPLYVTTSDTTNYNTSAAFYISVDGNILTNCYNDSFSNGIYLPNSNTKWAASNFYCHWYTSSLFSSLAHTFINMQGAGYFMGVVNGVYLNFANVASGTNIGVYCPDIYRSPHNEQYGINGLSITNNSLDAMTNGLYDLLWRQDVTHYQYGGAKTASADNKYYLLGAVPAGTVVSGTLSNRSRADMVYFRAYIHAAGTSSWVNMQNAVGFNEHVEIAFAEPVYIQNTQYFGVYVKNALGSNYTLELKNFTQPNLFLPFIDRNATGVATLSNVNITKTIN